MTRQDFFNCTLESLIDDIRAIRLKLAAKPVFIYSELLQLEDKIKAYQNATLPPIEVDAFFDDVRLEHEHAVTKYPAPNKNLAALVEEVGEVARALLENKPREQLYNECVQVATMAVRIAMEAESI